MTRGADIIAVIILIALAIAVIVYLLHWLYRRSSKEVSFVRTGMFGEKVVISGGAFVLPIIHNITQVGMRTLSLTIKRSGDKSLITKDRMRAELVTEFFTKVPPDKKAVSTAAQTLGNRTLDPEHLREVVQGRFADALGEVAANMTLDEIQENRGQFVKEVTKIADESIGHTGLALETVSMISLDQTPIEQFNPANTFDSQGLTQLTEQIEARKKKRNDITQDTKISIENKNLETIQKELEIKKNEEFSRYKQEREIAIQKANERTETIKQRSEREREAEEAEIRSQEEIEVAKISQNQVIEVERKLTETRLIEEIEKRRREQNELEQNAALDIRQKNLDTEVKILNLDKESEYARLEKQRLVDIKKAQERAEIIKEQAERQRDSEEAQIISEEQIKNAKISQSVLSAGKQEYVDDWVQFHGLRDYFINVLGIDNHYASGKKDIGKQWINEMECDPNNVLLIGDTLHDHEVASEMGVHCVLIANGHTSYDRLKNTGEMVFKDLNELHDHLKEILPVN